MAAQERREPMLTYTTLALKVAHKEKWMKKIFFKGFKRVEGKDTDNLAYDLAYTKCIQ